MSILQTWVHTPAAAALGWTLVHSLWEGALVALLLGAALFVLRSSRARYGASCLAMLAMLAGFGITFTRLLPPHIPAATTINALRLPPVPDGAGGLWTVPNVGGLAGYLPWLVPFWIGGVILFHLRGVLSWMATRRMRRTGVCCPPDPWRTRIDHLRERLRLSRPVTLLESCLTEVPVVIGYLRPVILMPVGLIVGLSPGQVEAILLHELAHIRRHDYLVNLLQVFVEGLVFYHPAVWWISGVIRAERENCCDDLVVSVRGDAYEYAAALAALEQNRGAMQEIALAATGGSLVKRVRRLLAQPEGPRAALSPLFSAAILTVTAVAVMAAWQTKPVPKSAPPVPERPAAAVAAPAVAPAAQVQQPAVKVLAQARPAPVAAPEEITPYRLWMTQDVAYIISDEERAAFKRLQTDEEREHFIEQFWLRRDPTPGTVENEFKEEHYRRIKYTNDRFSTSLAGWKTDRGRVYISYGPPDEKESHPEGNATTKVPFEEWLYHYIQGVGTNVIVEFIDPDKSGEYRMTSDPNAKNAQASEAFVKLQRPPAIAAPKAGASVQARGSGGASISIPLSAYRDSKVKLAGRILSMSGTPVTTFEESPQSSGPLYTKFIALPAGVYRFEVVVTDAGTFRLLASDNVVFKVE